MSVSDAVQGIPGRHFAEFRERRSRAEDRKMETIKTSAGHNALRSSVITEEMRRR